MGKKKTRTQETNKPIYSAEIGAASRANQAAYSNAQPLIDAFQTNATQASEDLFTRAREGDPAMTAAQGYITDTLSGDPASNPYLDDMVALSNNNLRNQLQANLGTRGLTGGSDYTDIISKALADSELGLRYDDYNSQQGRMERAAGMAPSITAGSLIPLTAAVDIGNRGAMAGLNAAALNSASTGGLLGQYQDRSGVQTQSGGLLGQVLGAALASGVSASDKRLKENVVHIGETPGGLPVYEYDYIWGGDRQRGVMAQDVAELQPDALGPEIGGYMTVNYDEVR